MSNAGGWETIHTKRKSKAEKRAEKAKLAAQNVDQKTVRLDTMYDEFVREEEPQKKTRKPLVNGRVDGFGINSNIGQGQGAAHKKSNKNKSKSKVADTPTSRMERVEKAIQDLKAEDVRKVLTTCKTGEPNNPLVWLTAVAHMFNMKIIGNVKDLVNSDKSFDYPANQFKKDVIQELQKFFINCTPKVVHEFQRLTIEHTIPTTLNRQDEFSSFGYLLLLQLWTLEQKQVSLETLHRLAVIRAKEQLRALVYQAQVWTLSRVGYLDTSKGLLVWKHLFLPVLNTKPFSHLSLNYLLEILSRHNLKNKLTGETLDGKDLFTLIQITYSTFATENNLQKKLIELFPALKIIVLDNLSGNLTIKMFTDLLTSLQVGTSNKIKKQVFPLLIQCLRREPKTFEAWKELYGRTSEQSNLLVDHISINFKEVGLNPNAVRKALLAFQKMDNTKQFGDNKKNLLRQMANSRCCHWRTIVLLLLLSVTLYYDVSRNGSLARSRTGRMLQDWGLLRPVQVLIVRNRPITDWVGVQYFKYLGSIDPHIRSGIASFDRGLDAVILNVDLYTREHRKNLAPAIAFVGKRAQKVGLLIIKNVNETASFAGRWLETNVFTGDYSMENIKIACNTLAEKLSLQYTQTANWASEQIASFLK